MANRTQKLKQQSTKTRAVMLLFLGGIIGQSSATIQQAEALSQTQVSAQVQKESLQVQVFDAIEKLHKEEDEWADNSLPTDQLIQMFSDEQLNQSILSHLEEQNYNKQSQKTNIRKLDCVVGSEKCLYKDKQSLINGRVTSFAQTALNKGMTIVLPGQSDLLGTDIESAEGIQIDSSAFDKEGKLNIDMILDKKLQQDIKNQKKQTKPLTTGKKVSPAKGHVVAKGSKLPVKKVQPAKKATVKSPQKGKAPAKKSISSVKPASTKTKEKSALQLDQISTELQDMEAQIKAEAEAQLDEEEMMEQEAKESKKQTEEANKGEDALKKQQDNLLKKEENELKIQEDEAKNQEKDANDEVIRAEAEKQLNDEEELKKKKAIEATRKILVQQKKLQTLKKLASQSKSPQKSKQAVKPQKAATKPAAKATIKSPQKKTVAFKPQQVKKAVLQQKNSELMNADDFDFTAPLKEKTILKKNVKPLQSIEQQSEVVPESKVQSLQKITEAAKDDDEQKVNKYIMKTNQQLDLNSKIMLKKAEDIEQEKMKTDQLNLIAEDKLFKEKEMIEQTKQQEQAKKQQQELEVKQKELEAKQKAEEEALRKKAIIEKQKKALAQKLKNVSLDRHQAIQRQKQALAVKLQKAAVDKHQQILAEEAREQAVELARAKAQELAEEKAAIITQQVLRQQEQIEMHNLQLQQRNKVQKQKQEEQMLILQQQAEVEQQKQEQLDLAQKHDEEVRNQREQMLKKAQEEQKKVDTIENERKKKETEDKEVLQLDFSEMVKQFKDTKDGNQGIENTNLQISSELKSSGLAHIEIETSDDLLAQTGGKNFEVAGQGMSFKLIPNNFGDLIDKISVVDMKKVSNNDKSNDQFMVTAQFTVNRDLSMLDNDSEMTLTQLSAENQHHHKHRKSDKIDEQFSEIQIQDMAQEKYTDQKVKEVIKNQQKALSEVNVIEENDKQEFNQTLQEMVRIANNKTNGTSYLSEAEQEANSLAKALQQHKLNVEKIDSKQFDSSSLKQTQQREENHHFSNVELSLLDGMSDLNLDGQSQVNSETLAKIQTQLESKVQKLLDKLTILTNNQYSKGKHVYDYQLIRLSESESKARSEALEKADAVFFKQSSLKRQEKEMNEKFETTKAQLAQYKQAFYKNKKTLQHDYNSVKEHKEQAEKEIQDQVALQKETEMSINESLQQKAELRLKQMQQEKKMEKLKLKKQVLVEQQIQKQKEKDNLMKIKEKEIRQVMAQQEARLEEVKRIKKESIQAEETKKQKMEDEIRAKLEHEIRVKKEAEDIKIKAEQMKKQQEDQLKTQVEKVKQDKAISEQKEKTLKKQKEIEVAEKQAKLAQEEQERLEKLAEKETEDLENKEREAMRKETVEVKKKQETAMKAKQALEQKQAVVEQQEKERIQAEKVAQEKAKKQAELKQKLVEDKKKQEETAQKKKQQENEEKAQLELKQAQEEQKKAEDDAAQLELQKALAEQKEAEVSQLKTENEARKSEKELQQVSNFVQTEQSPKADKQYMQLEESTEQSVEIQVKSDAQIKAEKDAIKQVTIATIQGIKKGEKASLKLHEDAKSQSEEQTTLAVSKLVDKYDQTKEKVVAIVSNFGKIHSDLQDLKREYLQEKSQMSSLLQVASNVSNTQDSGTNLKIDNLKELMANKKNQVQKVVDNFSKMHHELTSIKQDLSNEKSKEQLEDTQLSQLFARQSKKMFKSQESSSLKHKLKQLSSK